MNFCHSQNHGLVKVKEIWVIEAFGLSISSCILGLWRANVAFGIVRTAVSIHIFWGDALWALNWKGCWAGRFTQGCLVPLPLLYYQIQLELWPFYPQGWS